MDQTASKITSQGQVSVPAEVRRRLHLTPGATLVWQFEGDRVVVTRAQKHHR
jgi:antitoxin PrlF